MLKAVAAVDHIVTVTIPVIIIIITIGRLLIIIFAVAVEKDVEWTFPRKIVFQKTMIMQSPWKNYRIHVIMGRPKQILMRLVSNSTANSALSVFCRGENHIVFSDVGLQRFFLSKFSNLGV